MLEKFHNTYPKLDIDPMVLNGQAVLEKFTRTKPEPRIDPPVNGHNLWKLKEDRRARRCKRDSTEPTQSLESIPH